MNILIESFTLLSLGWLIIEFIRFTWNRPPATVVVEPDEDQPLPPADDEPDQHPQFHQVLPFRRPATRPQPTDRELIELAKRTGFKGASKWSYTRKLTQPVRSALLQLWNASEVAS